jgi:hypothetical protein
VEHIEAAIEETGIHRRVEQPPAICFLDLVGSTRLTRNKVTMRRPRSSPT